MKTNTVINICFLGCGRISDKHLRAINALTNSGVKLKSVCDLDATKLEKLSSNNEIYKSININDARLLSGVDLAVVATESGAHFKHAKFFLENDIDVLVEKPATLTLNDANELLMLAQNRGRKVYVVKQNRFNDAVQVAKDIYTSGKIGKLNIGTVRVRWCRPQSYYDQANWRGTWALDGGVISNQASHHIDLLQYFMGPVSKVTAFSKTFGVDIEVEDTLVAVLEFENGALGTFEATTSVRPRNIEGSISLIGSDGFLEIGGFAVNEIVRYETVHDTTSTLQHSETRKDSTDVYGDGHLHVYREILKDRLGHENDAVDLASSMEALRIIHMMYKSVETNSTIGKQDLGNGSDRLGCQNDE